MDCTKIIQPIETRWNTYTMCIQSIVKLKEVLLAIKDEDDPDLGSKIPTKRQFESLEEMMKPMLFIKDISDTLQTDSKPMIHMVVFFLLQLERLTRSRQFEGSSRTTKTFVQTFENQLAHRVKDIGRGVTEYCLGNFLHPYFKGKLLQLKESRAFDDTIKFIKELFKPKPLQQIPSQGSVDMFASQGSQTNRPASSDWGMDIDELMAEPGPGTPSQDKTPIEIELDRWLDATAVVRDVNIDILSYWKGKSKELPLLGQLAKNILAIQVTSSSSERLFSQAGLVVTPKRQLLATSQCEKLIFIHENHDLLAPLIGKWKTDIKDFSYPDKEKEKEPTPGPSIESESLLKVPEPEPEVSLRFRTSSNSDPDDPAMLEMNLIPEPVPDTPQSPDDFPTEDVLHLPDPYEDDDDNDVEEVEEEDE